MSQVLSKKFQRVQGFPWQKIEEQSLILNTELKMAHELNSPASLIWSLMDGQHSLSDICSQVCEEYEVELAEAQEDVLNLVKDLESHKLIQCL